MNKITTDNIFADLGFSAEEAGELNRKSRLMIELKTIMRRRKLNIVQAGKRFGVSKTVVTRLKKGDIDYFSIDMLIRMLECAGKEIQLVVSNKKRTRAA